MQLYYVARLRISYCWLEKGSVGGHYADWGNDWGSKEKDSVGW